MMKRKTKQSESLCDKELDYSENPKDGEHIKYDGNYNTNEEAIANSMKRRWRQMKHSTKTQDKEELWLDDKLACDRTKTQTLCWSKPYLKTMGRETRNKT